jgi:hypothetical protein
MIERAKKWFTQVRNYRSKNDKDHDLVNSWDRFKTGNATSADFELIVADLAEFTSYYYRPSFTDWCNKGNPIGSFETYCALLNARAEVFHRIMKYLSLPDETRIELQRAVNRLNAA